MGIVKLFLLLFLPSCTFTSNDRIPVLKCAPRPVGGSQAVAFYSCAVEDIGGEGLGRLILPVT